MHATYRTSPESLLPSVFDFCGTWMRAGTLETLSRTVYGGDLSSLDLRVKEWTNKPVSQLLELASMPQLGWGATPSLHRDQPPRGGETAPGRRGAGYELGPAHGSQGGRNMQAGWERERRCEVSLLFFLVLVLVRVHCRREQALDPRDRPSATASLASHPPCGQTRGCSQRSSPHRGTHFFRIAPFCS
jgi:hypothetical protein